MRNYEVGEEQVEAFIVMQFVEGTTLAERMREKPLVLKEALDIAIQVADALSEAHSRGIIHRDIKPQNIMVTSRGHAKVMDFGLATMTRAHSAIDSMSETASFSTEQGVIAGTIPYMSPEQVKGEQLDVRSDIFSFGVLLYEMTAGVNPFEASSLAETISAILATKPAPLGSYSYDVPDDLQRVVDRCLEKNKENRYQSTSELVAVLRQLRLEVDSGSATRINARKQNKLRLLTALILMVLALGSVFLFWFFHNSAPKHNIRSLLIMPFVNASNDPDVEYLSDGVSESLINSISQLSELKVIARTTAFRYKGSEADPKQIGRDLDVDAVMTGRVTQQGDSLVVQADLLNTADGSEIWGAKYSKKLSDVFAVQEQITREITANLRFKITSEESQALSKHYTANIKAYQDYMIGYNYLQRRTGHDFFTAISYFESAIEEEPNYALAYAALTEAYISMTVRGLVDGVEGSRKAEECARKALSCDQNLAEALVAIAQLYADFPRTISARVSENSSMRSN